jgi:hypothetical protein
MNILTEIAQIGGPLLAAVTPLVPPLYRWMSRKWTQRRRQVVRKQNRVVSRRKRAATLSEWGMAA